MPDRSDYSRRDFPPGRGPARGPYGGPPRRERRPYPAAGGGPYPPREARRDGPGNPGLGDLAGQPRTVVTRRLVEEVERFPELRVSPLSTQDMAPLDAAFSHAIYDAAVRRWLTINHLLSSVSNVDRRRLEPTVHAALLCGAAQILFMDRVPAYAAINEAVELVKRVASRGAAGLVNAALRRVAEHIAPDQGAPAQGDPATTAPGGLLPQDAIPLDDGRMLRLTRPLLPADTTWRIAVATSHPEPLIRRWVEQFGHEEAQRLALHSIARPPTILNLPPEKLEGEPVIAHDIEGHSVFTGDHNQLISLLHRRNDCWVQDPASTHAIRSVKYLTPRLIADFCAGQGTKTRQLAAAFPAATVFAADPDKERVEKLIKATRHEPRIRITDHNALGREQTGTLDLVLLDVPCSNSGVLARRAEARYRGVDAQLARLIPIQRSIIADAMRLLRPGGFMLYSTCSLEREENEAMIEWATHTGALKLISQERIMPKGGPGGPVTEYHDGSYSALLRLGEFAG